MSVHGFESTNEIKEMGHYNRGCSSFITSNNRITVAPDISSQSDCRSINKYTRS
jgi:hypothetical protein